MNMSFVSQILLCLVLLIVQALVLNNIHLFGFATPLLYVYTVICMRRNFPRWAALVISFLLGLGIDIFSNTPGVAACSLTLLAFVQPLLLSLFLPRDSADDFLPTIYSLGVAKYINYAFIATLLYCVVFYTLEMFNFFNWILWLECVGGSTLITLLILVVVDNMRRK